MFTHLERATVFVLYQLSLLTGIVLLPMALVMRKVGLSLPINRVIDRLEAAYEDMDEPVA
jgi:hypothetical protein